jgi:hypothetical protein
MSATLLTPADLLKLPDGERHLELIRGVVRTRHKGTQASYVTGQLLDPLMQYADLHGHWVFSWSLGYNCFCNEPNTVRHTSATLITTPRFSVEQLQRDEPFCDVPPDLVVEVFGMDDTATALDDAFRSWFQAGTRLIWLIDPRSRTVASHRRDGTIVMQDSSDTLTAPDLLPGFSVPVADLFRLPGEPAPAAAAPI